MLIRKAVTEDIDSLLKILKQISLIHHNGRPDLFKAGTKYTRAQLENILVDETRYILVADDNGVIKGYAFCIFQQHVNDNVLTDIKTLYLDDLCVDQDFRGQHIGKALYSAALQLAKNSGCYNLTLNAWCFNKAAMAFYESCGMNPLKVYMEEIIK